ncbi:DUF2892 domain-containing protein [Halobacteriales archaeon QS_8_69_26]|nr:MAG: DUF2892 domain-containing protein [Halobacteriales archaeon QS_8_69_26]
MQKNVGGPDRVARLVLGPVLVALGAASYLGYVFPVDDAAGRTVAGVVVLSGLVFLATGAIQRCAFNRLTGTNTYEEPTRWIRAASMLDPSAAVSTT